MVKLLVLWQGLGEWAGFDVDAVRFFAFGWLSMGGGGFFAIGGLFMRVR